MKGSASRLGNALTCTVSSQPVNCQACPWVAWHYQMRLLEALVTLRQEVMRTRTSEDLHGHPFKDTPLSSRAQHLLVDRIQLPLEVRHRLWPELCTGSLQRAHAGSCIHLQDKQIRHWSQLSSDAGSGPPCCAGLSEGVRTHSCWDARAQKDHAHSVRKRPESCQVHAPGDGGLHQTAPRVQVFRLATKD